MLLNVQEAGLKRILSPINWETVIRSNKRKQELERVLSNVSMILQIEENKFKIQIEF